MGLKKITKFSKYNIVFDLKIFSIIKILLHSSFMLNFFNLYNYFATNIENILFKKII